MTKRRARAAARFAVATALFCTAWVLPWVAGSRAGTAPLLQQPGLPVIAVIGCKLVGGALVCGRDGTLLPNRLRRPKARAKEPAKTYKPAQKKTPAKSPSSKSGTSKSAPAATSGQDADNESDVDSAVPNADDAAQDSATHSCPPGHVVLEEPNAAGSHCEPVGAGTAVSEPSPSKDAPAAPPKETAPAAPEVAAGSTEIPDDIRGAACGPGSAPGACACPGESAYDSEACKGALPSCCSAKVSADGKLQPALSRCGADQNKAMSAIVSSAMEKKLTLGPVRCTNR